jgi:hypothetical protein
VLALKALILLEKNNNLIVFKGPQLRAFFYYNSF